MAKAHVMLFAIPPDGEIKPFRQRVDDGHANSVQTARYLVGIVVGGVFELTACMQLGHDDLGGRNTLFGVNSRWNPATIVVDRYGTVRVQSDQDAVAMAGQRLVDCIVADLEDHVVEA